jgi:hypothetical protein
MILLLLLLLCCAPGLFIVVIAGYALWFVLNAVGLLSLVVTGILAYALIELGLDATTAFFVAAGLLLAVGAAITTHNDPSCPDLFSWSGLIRDQ